MPVENADFISDLDQSNPLVGDVVAQGDDHLRLVKKVLVQSFPNVDAAVTASDEELNTLIGNTTPVKDIASALNAILALDSSQWPTLSNAAGDAVNDITFSAGTILDSTRAVSIDCLALTKQTDNPWQEGDNLGGVCSGATITNTVHCFVVWNNTDQESDYCFDDNVAGSNVLSGTDPKYTHFRRVGSVPYSSGVIGFTHIGREYFKTDTHQMVINSNIPANPTAIPLGVPEGLNVYAKVAASAKINSDSSPSSLTMMQIMLSSGVNAITQIGVEPSLTTHGASMGAHFNASGPQTQIDSCMARLMTDTNRQIYIDSLVTRVAGGDTYPSGTYGLALHSWIDNLDE